MQLGFILFVNLLSTHPLYAVQGLHKLLSKQISGLPSYCWDSSNSLTKVFSSISSYNMFVLHSTYEMCSGTFQGNN